MMRRKPPNFGRHQCHTGPIADMLDHAVGMNDIKAVICIFRQGAGVTRSQCVWPIVNRRSFQVYDCDMERKIAPQILHTLPICFAPANIEQADARGASKAVLKLVCKQPKAFAAKAIVIDLGIKNGVGARCCLRPWVENNGIAISVY